MDTDARRYDAVLPQATRLLLEPTEARLTHSGAGGGKARYLRDDDQETH